MAGIADGGDPGAVLVTAEALLAGGSALFAGAFRGDFGGVDEGSYGVHEGPVVFAGVVKAVREVDAETAELGREPVELVVGSDAQGGTDESR